MNSSIFLVYANIRVADLVDPDHQARVQASLRSPRMKEDREYVDIIIALGMAKEGFDWIWCEHALTVGYRSSLTEIVQIIGRATRDAPDKTHARFTNLIAEPDAEEDKVTEAVNDTLKAIAASLLMEQVLVPRFEFSPKNIDSQPIPGVDYGENGYQEGKTNVGVDQKNGRIHLEIKGLAEPKSTEAQRICKEDLNEIIAPLLQKKTVVERGLFDEETVPQEITQVEMGKIIQEKFPDLSDDDKESVRQHAIAALNVTQQAKKVIIENNGADNEPKANTAFVSGVQKYVMDVRELDIDLIDSINPFSEAYSILAKTMSEGSLRRVAAIISAKKTKLSPEDAKDFAIRAYQFKIERGRAPSATAADPWEAKLAEGAKAFMRFKADGRYDN